MIYVASLSLHIKKVMGKENVANPSITMITDNLQIDPGITGMDTVILGFKDTLGLSGKQLKSALTKKHENICVIYVHSKESEKEGIKADYYIPMPGKLKMDTLAEAVKKSLLDFDTEHGNLEIEENAEMEDMLSGNSYVERDNLTYEESVETAATIEPVSIPNADYGEDTLVYPKIPEVEQVKSVETIKREEILNNASSIADFDMLINQLKKDNISKQLILENTEYQGLVQMINILESEIVSTFSDRHLNADQKMEQITQLGLRKSTLRAKTNDITANKVIHMIEMITAAATRAVEEKINSVNGAISHIIGCKKDFLNTTEIDDAIEKRTSVYYDLLAAKKKLIELYAAMDGVINEEIEDLRSKLPSNSELINHMMPESGMSVFTPVNCSALAIALMDAVQKNRITVSQLERHIEEIMKDVFNLFQMDTDIMSYQSKLIKKYEANQVEDVIIRDSLLKYVLHIYTGADETGKTATALTWSGILSRRQNTLLIDVTGNAHFDRYGVESISLRDFTVERIERPFLCVDSYRRLDAEEVQNLVVEIRSRLNYYNYINIIVSPEDTEVLEQLGKDALTISFITDCSNRSLEIMKDSISKFNQENITKKLIMIDTPVSPLMIVDKLGCAEEGMKVKYLPNINTLKACSIENSRPYEKDNVLKIFEEALR